MTIRLEILNISAGSVNVALYYPVPSAIYSPASVDTARTPAGIALNATEIQDLKDGKLFEYIDSLNVNGRTLPQMRVALEKLWDDRKLTAKDKYIDDYKYAGRSWDGTTWS